MNLWKMCGALRRVVTARQSGTMFRLVTLELHQAIQRIEWGCVGGFFTPLWMKALRILLVGGPFMSCSL